MAPWVPAAIMGGSMLASSALGAMGSGKGGGADVDYEWSDEQKQAYNQAQPWVQQRVGQALQGPPQMGAPPSIYDIPDSTGLTPTKGWYDSIAPEVKQGLWEPWNDASNQMMQNMSGVGQFGTPGAGMSGAALNAQGSLYADAGQQVGQQAWNMMAPGQSQLFNANLGRNAAQYETSLQPWQNNYQSSMQDWGIGQQQMGNMAAGQPTGIISQQGNPYAGAASGALTGAIAGYQMASPYMNQQQPYQMPMSVPPNNALSGYGMYGGGTPGY